MIVNCIMCDSKINFKQYNLYKYYPSLCSANCLKSYLEKSKHDPESIEQDVVKADRVAPWFRSQYEVSFARFLSNSGIKYQYEPFFLSDKERGKIYLPDFYLPDHGIFFEVKGKTSGIQWFAFDHFFNKYPGRFFLITKHILGLWGIKV